MSTQLYKSKQGYQDYSFATVSVHAFPQWSILKTLEFNVFDCSIHLAVYMHAGAANAGQGRQTTGRRHHANNIAWWTQLHAVLFSHANWFDITQQT